MSDYPQAKPRHCIDEENRGKYAMLRPPEIWRVELMFSARCSGFLSKRKYGSFEASNKAASRLNKKLEQLTGGKDD